MLNRKLRIKCTVETSVKLISTVIGRLPSELIPHTLVRWFRAPRIRQSSEIRERDDICQQRISYLQDHRAVYLAEDTTICVSDSTTWHHRTLSTICVFTWILTFLCDRTASFTIFMWGWWLRLSHQPGNRFMVCIWQESSHRRLDCQNYGHLTMNNPATQWISSQSVLTSLCNDWKW